MFFYKCSIIMQKIIISICNLAKSYGSGEWQVNREEI